MGILIEFRMPIFYHLVLRTALILIACALRIACAFCFARAFCFACALSFFRTLLTACALRFCCALCFACGLRGCTLCGRTLFGCTLWPAWVRRCVGVLQRIDIVKNIIMQFNAGAIEVGYHVRYAVDHIIRFNIFIQRKTRLLKFGGPAFHNAGSYS